MFVPVVTKDMQLFAAAGNQRGTAQRLKNVRSRAQSLEAANAASASGSVLAAAGHAAVGHHSAANGAAKSKVAPASSAADIGGVFALGGASRQRNCRSVGALPTSGQQAVTSRSPPKNGSLRKPLDPIAEGIPTRGAKKCGSIKSAAKPPLPNGQNCTIASHNGNGCAAASAIMIDDQENMSSMSNRSTPDLHLERLLRPAANGVLVTTASSPGLHKTGGAKHSATTTTATATTLSAALTSESCNGSSTNSNGNQHSSGGKRIVKWLANTLKGRNGSIHQHRESQKMPTTPDAPAERRGSSSGAPAGDDAEKQLLFPDNGEAAKPWRSIVSPTPRRQYSDESTPSDDDAESGSGTAAAAVSSSPPELDAAAAAAKLAVEERVSRTMAAVEAAEAAAAAVEASVSPMDAEEDHQPPPPKTPSLDASLTGGSGG